MSGFQWTTFWSILLGGIAFLLLQIVWCCRMNACGLAVAGTMALIAGCCDVVAGILVLTYGADPICDQIQANNPSEYVDDDQCKVGVNGYAAIAFIGGAIWIAVSILVFMFSCGGRYHQATENAANIPALKSNAAVVVAEEQPAAAEDKA
ncbi:MAG: hypothetical protein SGARI_004323 [Bacillariaceae sp.]